jgi:2'-5' RNA ligase
MFIGVRIMSEQLCFPGFPEPRPADDRLFFGLVPSAADVPEIVSCIQCLRTRFDLRGKPLLPAHLHISLYWLGDYVCLPKAVVAAACEAGAMMSAPTFNVIFDRAMSFYRKGRTCPFVLRPSDDIIALSAVYRALGEAMTKVGLRRWVSSHFTPHMTMLYDQQIVKEQAVETLRWRANELVLVHSLLRRNRHIHLARWPLRGD